MLPLGECRVIQREVFEQLDVGCQAHTDVGSFDQVMAEKPLFGKAPVENLMKSRDVVYCLSMKDRFTEQILLGIRNRRAVRIRSLSVGEYSSEPRCGGTRQRDTDSRLDD